MLEDGTMLQAIFVLMKAKLHEGKLNNNELICPWHGARWDITSGKMMILFPEKLKSLRSFKVIVQNDNLCIKRD
ncbi:MAG: Rieske (2Fe-2S) protein [Nitrososphaeraceae archaeon]